MKVFGYTDEKTLVQVDLQPEVIVKHKIDPWRIDLCDPNPIALPHGDRTLYFRKLGDVAFAYSLNGKTVVCIKDDRGETCMRTETAQTTRSGAHPMIIEAGKLIPADGPFAQHLCNFLQESDSETGGENGPSRFLTIEPAKDMVLHATTLRFTLPQRRTWHGSVNLVGSMFDEIRLTTKLPREVNFVLRALQEFQPRVWMYHNLERLFLNEPFPHVRVEVLHPDIMNGSTVVEAKLRAATRLRPRKTKTEDHEFRLKLRNKGTISVKVLYGRREPDPHYSLDDLYAESVDEIVGTRIAFHDMSRGRAVAVNAETLKKDIGNALKYRRLYRARGYAFLLPELLPLSVPETTQESPISQSATNSG